MQSTQICFWRVHTQLLCHVPILQSLTSPGPGITIGISTTCATSVKLLPDVLATSRLNVAGNAGTAFIPAVSAIGDDGVVYEALLRTSVTGRLLMLMPSLLTLSQHELLVEEH